MQQPLGQLHVLPEEKLICSASVSKLLAPTTMSNRVELGPGFLDSGSGRDFQTIFGFFRADFSTSTQNVFYLFLNVFAAFLSESVFCIASTRLDFFYFAIMV